MEKSVKQVIFSFASAYRKGEVFLAQLGYIIGQGNLRKTIKKYFEDFKHLRCGAGGEQ